MAVSGTTVAEDIRAAERLRVSKLRQRFLVDIVPQAIADLDALFKEHAKGGMGQFLRHGVVNQTIAVSRDLYDQLQRLEATDDAALLRFAKERILAELEDLIAKVKADSDLPA